MASFYDMVRDELEEEGDNDLLDFVSAGSIGSSAANV